MAQNILAGKGRPFAGFALILSLSSAAFSILVIWLHVHKDNVRLFSTVSDIAQDDLFFLAIGSVVAAGLCIIISLFLRPKSEKKVAKPLAVPQPTSVEFPYPVFDLHFAEVDWKVYAQDYRPLPGEALLIVGQICPSCSTEMIESCKKSNYYEWLCANCQYSTAKQKSAVAALEAVQQLAQRKLKEELERKWQGRQISIEDSKFES